jgi:two-component system KDP operon response regulator KdpE
MQSSGSTRVLVIDDETPIRSIVRAAVESSGGVALEAATATHGLELARTERPALIVLDLGLPDAEGIAVCREIRRWSAVPILVLSARHSEAEKVALLDAGADDYLTKPFSTVELQARVRAHLRRATMGPVPGGDAPIVAGALRIDLASRAVERDGAPVHLTPTEWGLLHALVSRAGRTVTHRQLFDAVWGRNHGDAQQYLRVYVAHLRRKLEVDPLRPALILTEPGVGYRFEVPGASVRRGAHEAHAP